MHYIFSYCYVTHILLNMTTFAANFLWFFVCVFFLSV